MPSPVAHLSVGYLIFRVAGGWFRRGPIPAVWSGVFVFLFCLLISLLPDIDAVLGVLLSDMEKYHNNMTHSLMMGGVMALVLGLLLKVCGILDFRRGFLVVLLSCYLHVLMDYFSYGRGVMLFWPMTDTRYSPPVFLFRGLRWSEGIFALEHIWTFLTEFLFAGSLILLAEGVRKKTED